MPKYVRRPGIQILEPPYLAEETTFFAFVIRTDPDTVQRELIDPYLNAPLGTLEKPPAHYKLKTRFVLAVFNHIANFKCIDQPDSQIGRYTEEEFAIWMLIEDEVSGNNYWYHPYMVVDNVYALTIGREVYGFPKGIAQFDMTKTPERKPLQARAIAIPQFDPTHMSSWMPIATALPPFVREYADPAFEENDFEDSGSFLDAIHAHIVPPEAELANFAAEEHQGLIGDVALIVAKLLGLDAPFLFLKQFPGAADTGEAVYQAIVEAPLEVTRVRKVRPLLPWRVELADYDSHPILRTLGRKGDASIRPWFSGWLLMDFHVPPGKVLHQIT